MRGAAVSVPAQPSGLRRGRQALAIGLILVACGGAPPATTPASQPVATHTITLDRAEVLGTLDRLDRLMDGAWLAHPDAEGMKARARGETVDGPLPPAGVALGGVTPGGWADRLGLRNDDVLQRLDGADIDGAGTLVSVAWDLAGRLRERGGWSFEAWILRDGRPLALRYVVPSEGGAAAGQAGPRAPEVPTR